MKWGLGSDNTANTGSEIYGLMYNGRAIPNQGTDTFKEVLEKTDFAL